MEMSAGEKIKILLKRNNMNMGDLAKATGQTQSNLSNKMKRDNFSESDIREMAAAIGYTVEIRFVDSDGNVAL